VKEVAAAPPPPPPPAPSLGQATGSPQGAGALTLNVTDFPYAWYIQSIHRKIQERWEGRAIQGRQPEVIFEIARDGQVKRLVIGKSSGNPAYDQIAMRAIAEANPFPPLPDGFGKSVLTIGLQFVYDPTTR
jgi:TonB family protein